VQTGYPVLRQDRVDKSGARITFKKTASSGVAEMWADRLFRLVDLVLGIAERDLVRVGFLSLLGQNCPRVLVVDSVSKAHDLGSNVKFAG
jgi:hypothetical protein